MREISTREAIREALLEEMNRDPSVFLMGQDIGTYGGAFRVTEGLADEFGEERVIDTPISESAMVGAGVGAAMRWMRPIVELQYADFITIAMDQLVNNAAKMRYLHAGKQGVPLVVRAPFGAGRSAGVHHSQSVESWLANVPGLKLLMPSCPMDAKGLLKSAIRDPDPCVFFEHKLLYSAKGPVPEEEYLTPIGSADVKRPGRDLTIVATGLMCHYGLRAARQLERFGVDAEVVDPRTLVPLDVRTIVESVKKTGKLLVCHEAPKTGGFSGEIIARVAEEALAYIDSPIRRVTAPDAPVPFSPVLERFFLPGEDDIVRAALDVVDVKADRLPATGSGRG